MWVALGSDVRCADERVGKLADVLVDPRDGSVTHVAVDGDDGEKRLVPVGLAEAEGRRGITLGCSVEELHSFEPIRHYAYVPYGDEPNGADVGVEEVVAAPPFAVDQFGTYGPADTMVGVVYDRIPPGEVELSRKTDVESVDGSHLGRLGGLVVEERRITYVVVRSGKPWRARETAVPYRSVEHLATGVVTLGLSRDELAAIPSAHVGGRR
jgi:sporulation protein YlmC with PRC-barrel domain